MLLIIFAGCRAKGEQEGQGQDNSGCIIRVIPNTAHDYARVSVCASNVGSEACINWAPFIVNCWPKFKLEPHPLKMSEKHLISTLSLIFLLYLSWFCHKRKFQECQGRGCVGPFGAPDEGYKNGTTEHCLARLLHLLCLGFGVRSAGIKYGIKRDEASLIIGVSIWGL